MSQWSMIGLVLLSVLVLAELWRMHLSFWKEHLSMPMHYAHEETLTMPDGAVIELRRLRHAAPDADAVPVLLVHGIAVNHRNNDPSPERSFARFLSLEGRDVWLLTMRSGRTRPSLFGPEHHAFSAMRDHDLPRGVDAVLARTGQSQLDLVAYSMGGMVMYAAIGRTLHVSRVRRAVAFASPGKVRTLGPLAFARYLPRSLTPTLPMRIVTRSFAFAHALLPGFITRVFYNPSNVPAHIARQSMVDMFSDIPGQLGADFVRWAAAGGELVLDGERVLDGLHAIRVPACFFAGSVDLLAPADLVRAAYDAWGKGVPELEKHFILLGRESGARDEYGHGDFAFGTHAHEEVFTPAARFLAQAVPVRHVASPAAT